MILPPTNESVQSLDNEIPKRQRPEVVKNTYEDITYEEGEIDNESTCNECHGGGELVCCDGCVKAYHTDCLNPAKRPRLDLEGEWFCPDCQYKYSRPKKVRVNSTSEVQNKPYTSSRPSPSSMNINSFSHNLLSPSNINFCSTKNPTNSPSIKNSTPIKNAKISNTPLNSQLSKSSLEANRAANRAYHLANRSRLVAKSSTSTSADTISPRNESIGTIENSSKNVPKKKKKPIDEGPLDQNRINIGPHHQIPSFPEFFLNRDFTNNTTGSSRIISKRASEQAKLVYSPFCLEKIRQKRLYEGKEGKIVEDDTELTEFIETCAKNWRNSSGWQPFSPEFAYKILHSAEYDPERAIQLMSDPQFSFQLVCDPPSRKYENKWKPKDRRSTRLVPPFPPTVCVKTYFSRRNNHNFNSLR